VALLGQAIAAAIAAASLVACYQPTLRDCTVSCTSAADCAGDQVCGAGGWCATEGVACSVEPDATENDAITDASGNDASDDDGTMPIDASTDVPIDAGAVLRTVISGRGSVAGDYPGVDCMGPQGDCSFGIPPGTSVMLTAVDGPGGHAFVDWTTPNCMGMGRTCTVTVTAPITLVGVTFN
jgi:hypothetical protein